MFLWSSLCLLNTRRLQSPKILLPNCMTANKSSVIEFEVSLKDITMDFIFSDDREPQRRTQSK